MKSVFEASFSWLTLLLTFLLINHSSTPYKVHSTLIDDVCNKATFPKDCHGCLDSYPESSNMTQRELVGATIVCANNQCAVMAESFLAAANMSEFLKLPILKLPFTGCSMDMSAMQERLMQALDSWRSGDNIEAKNKVDDGIYGFNLCNRTLTDVSSIAHFDITVFIPKDKFLMLYDFLDNSKKLVALG